MQRASLACKVLSLLGLGALSGCDNPEKWRFREEVILNDGKQVLVSRTALRNNVWPRLGNGGHRSIVNQWITYEPLSVELELQKLGRHAYQVFSFGVLEGKPHVAVLPAFITMELSRYCAAHPDKYRVHFWAKHGATWREVEQSDILLDTLMYNLLYDVEWAERVPQQQVMTLQAKSERAKHDFRERTTVREFLSGRYGTRCDFKG